jgi:hypothetical protein
MVINPAGLGTKNDCVGEDLQKFTRLKVRKCDDVKVLHDESVRRKISMKIVGKNEFSSPCHVQRMREIIRTTFLPFGYLSL